MPAPTSRARAGILRGWVVVADAFVVLFVAYGVQRR